MELDKIKKEIGNADKISTLPDLSRFVIDISLGIDFPRNVNHIELMKALLKELYPEHFLHAGDATKLLEIAIERYKDYLNKDHKSLADIAESVKWKRKSKGAVSGYQKKLKVLGFSNDNGSFNSKFLIAMYGKLVSRISRDNNLLRHIKGLVHHHTESGDKVIDPEILQGQPFQFSNSGQLIIAMSNLLKKVPQGGDISLALREGSTWGSEGIGEYLKKILEDTVNSKQAKLRVMTSSKMKEDLQNFFGNVGQVLTDEELATSGSRKMYAADWVVTIHKLPGIRMPVEIISGTIEKDIYNEHDGFLKKFEQLSKKKR